MPGPLSATTAVRMIAARGEGNERDIDFSGPPWRDGVLDQIGEELHQKLAVAPDVGATRAIELRFFHAARILDDGLVDVGDVAASARTSIMAKRALRVPASISVMRSSASNVSTMESISTGILSARVRGTPRRSLPRARA